MAFLEFRLSTGDRAHAGRDPRLPRGRCATDTGAICWGALNIDRSDEPPRQRHRRSSEPAPAAATLARDPGPGDRDRPAEERTRPAGRACDHPQRIPDGHGLRARVSVAVLCAGDRRRQDAAHGRVHQLSAPGARHQQFLRAGAEPDDLQQADRGLHARTRRSTCSRALPNLR